MIKPLTSLRFIFAIMVFASHLKFLSKSESKVLRWVYENIFYEGYIGVGFFFILSGFILAYTYQDSFIKGNSSNFKFYIARLARIYPLHLLTFVLSIPLTLNILANSPISWGMKAIANLTLLQSFIPNSGVYFSFNSPSWSISDEMFFYLTFPLLIFITQKLLSNKFKKIMIICIVFTVPLLEIIIPSEYYHQLFYINPVLRVFDFFLGILLFNLYKYLIKQRKIINYTNIEVVSILLLFVFFIFHSWIPDVMRYSYYYWIPMSCLILSFSFQKGFISKLLSHKLLIHLGDISFGFYMFHLLVLKYFDLLNTRILFIENDFLIVAVTFIISIIVSHYSYRLFETPLNKLIRNTFNSKKKISTSISLGNTV